MYADPSQSLISDCRNTCVQNPRCGATIIFEERIAFLNEVRVRRGFHVTFVIEIKFVETALRGNLDCRRALVTRPRNCCDMVRKAQGFCRSGICHAKALNSRTALAHQAREERFGVVCAQPPKLTEFTHQDVVVVTCDHNTDQL